MSLELFQKLPTEAIETLFNEQNQPLFKRANLGKYLGIEDIKTISKTFLHITTAPGPTWREWF